MNLSDAKVVQKVLYGKQRGEIAYIPTFVSDKNNAGYNCVEVCFENTRNALGEIVDLSKLVLIKTIEVTEDDLIPCDSDICLYCANYKQEAFPACTECFNYDNFLGIEAYRTAED